MDSKVSIDAGIGDVLLSLEFIFPVLSSWGGGPVICDSL